MVPQGDFVEAPHQFGHKGGQRGVALAVLLVVIHGVDYLGQVAATVLVDMVLQQARRVLGLVRHQRDADLAGADDVLGDIDPGRPAHLPAFALGCVERDEALDDIGVVRRLEQVVDEGMPEFVDR